MRNDVNHIAFGISENVDHTRAETSDVKAKKKSVNFRDENFKTCSLRSNTSASSAIRVIASHTVDFSPGVAKIQKLAKMWLKYKKYFGSKKPTWLKYKKWLKFDLNTRNTLAQIKKKYNLALMWLIYRDENQILPRINIFFAMFELKLR